MPRNSGVVFIAAGCFPSVGWYHVDSCLDYSCPAASPPGVNQLATLEDIEEFSIFRPKFSVNQQKEHLSDVSYHIGGRK